jgi:lipoate synthase
MDKAEAERVAKAIRRMPVEWIAVRAVERNSLTNTYEVICAYKRQSSRRDTPWTIIQIATPRQWIDLLTQHGPDVDDLDLP